MKKLLSLILLLVTIATQSQTIKENTVYLNFSAGLSRSEDGLEFLVKESANQWSPMINIGVGYRFNKNLGIELNSSAMVTSIDANGALKSNNQQVKIEARHSNIIFSPVVFLPISNKSEIFLKVGYGVLFSQSKINTSLNNEDKVSTNNTGYLIGLGYNRQITNNIVLSAQFDFSDSYGKKEVWTGDLGLLHIGIRYLFNKNKLKN